MSGHGGLSGVRDITLLESALAWPQKFEAYESADVVELAAAYAYGIARNHSFVDGNKRTAFVAAITFLIDNSAFPDFKEVDVVLTIMKIAASKMTERELTVWFRGCLRSGLYDDAAEYIASRKPKVSKRKAAKKKLKKKS